MLRAWLEQDGIDHLHVHFGSNADHRGLALPAPGRAAGTASRSTARRSSTSPGPSRWARRSATPNSRWRSARSAGASSGGGPTPGDWGKVHVVHCGVDPRYLDAPPSPPSTAPRLINIGRLVEQKGQLILVEASALLRDRGRDVRGDRHRRRHGPRGPRSPDHADLGPGRPRQARRVEVGRGGPADPPRLSRAGAPQLRRGPAGGHHGGPGPPSGGDLDLHRRHPRAGPPRRDRLARPRRRRRRPDPTRWPGSSTPPPTSSSGWASWAPGPSPSTTTSGSRPASSWP